MSKKNIYFFSDYYIYYFENIYPIYLHMKDDHNCIIEATFERQEGFDDYAKFNNTKYFQSIISGKFKPDLVILTQCWYGLSNKLSNYCSSKNIPYVIFEHGAQMLLYSKSKASYRGKLKRAKYHFMWGNKSKNIMKDCGAKESLLPVVGSPRLSYFFSKANKIPVQRVENSSLIIGTSSNFTSRNILNKIKYIKDKSSSCYFKGHPRGLRSIKGIDNLSFDTSSDYIFKKFLSVQNVYFDFPSSMMIMAKMSGCRTFAMYTDSNMKSVESYYNKNKSHIPAYNEESPSFNRSHALKWIDLNIKTKEVFKDSKKLLEGLL